MSINRRTAIAVRSIGVASAAAAIALGVAGNAFACNITEFTPTASCDNAGHGVITVVDTDTSQTPVDITLKQGDTVVGTKAGVVGSEAGTTVTFTVDWQPVTMYTVDVKRSSGENVGEKVLTTPAQACQVATTPATTPATTTPPATTPATPTATTSAPVVATSTNAPSPAAGGSQNLAETGGGSNTGMIAGIAAACVAVGGGAVFVLRRRNPASRH